MNPYVTSGLGVLGIVAFSLFLVCGVEWAKSRVLWQRVGLALLFAVMGFVLLGVESEPHVSEMVAR